MLWVAAAQQPDSDNEDVEYGDPYSDSDELVGSPVSTARSGLPSFCKASAMTGTNSGTC